MNQKVPENPDTDGGDYIRHVKRKAFITGMFVMAAAAAPLMAASYALGLLGYQIAHLGFP